MSFKNSKPKWDGGKSPAANAKAILPRLAEAYFAEGDKLLASQPTLEEYHELRLATKHFRYLLENFEPLYGAGLLSRIEDLRAIQRILGELNDCAVTQQLLRGRTANGLQKILESQVGALSDEFAALWANRFSPERRRLWINYLRTHAGRRPRTPRKPGGRAVRLREEPGEKKPRKSGTR